MRKLLAASAVSCLMLLLTAVTKNGPAAAAGPKPCACDVETQTKGTWDQAALKCTGLGTECTSGTECASGQCAQSSEGAYCVEPCMLDADQCPSGFGCVDANAGDGMGICFPGAGEEGGCLSAGSGSGAPIAFGLGFAAFVFARRRRRS